MSRALMAWTFTAVAVSLLGPPAWAEDKADDEALIRRGVELRRAGRDQEALEAFRAAYRARPTPRAQGQMGLAEQALGRWVEAARDLEAALEATDDPWTSKNLSTLRPAAAEVAKHLGRIQVLGRPSGAEVKVDDEPVGVLPMGGPARVAAGEVVISVSAPGHIAITRKVSVAPGQIARETISLHAESAGAAVAAASGEGGATIQDRPPSRDREPADSMRPLRLGAWVAAGLGAAALGLGVAENLSYLSKRDSFDRGLPAGRCGAGLPNRGAVGCSGLYDDMNGAKTIAVVGYVAAGVLGAGATLLFVLSGHAEPERRLACAPQGAGIGCALAF